MELLHLLVLGIIVSSVSTTPHGYGVKSGAVAKAEAGAGAFAGLPNVAALGGGNGAALVGASGGPYIGAGNGGLGGSFTSSGSFSKSSAASFASSSASSYSFSGAGGYSAPSSGGTEGYISPGAVGQGTSSSGSATDDSHNTSVNGPSAQSPSSGIQNAATGAYAGSGSNGYIASGANPEGYAPTSNSLSNGKCGASGNCASEPEISKPIGNPGGINFAGGVSGTHSAAASNAFSGSGSGSKCGGSHKCDTAIPENKCTSGNCGTKPQQQLPNDKSVIVAGYPGAKTSYDADEQSFYNKKPSAPIDYDVSNCATGKCNVSPSGPSVNVPFEGNNQVSPNNYTPQGSDKCTTPNCNSYSFNPEPSGTNNEPRPSYNPTVPATYLTAPKDTNSKYEPCPSGNCGNPVPPNNLPTTGTGAPPANPNNGGVYSQNSYPAYNPSTTNKVPTPCNSPNCGNVQGSTYHTNSNNAAASASGSNYATGASYNPAGTKCTSLNCDKSSENSPHYSGSPNYSAGNLPTFPVSTGVGGTTNCGSPICGNYPATQVGAGAGVTGAAGAYGNQKPNNNYPQVKPTNNQPIYGGGFGGPSGLLKPNEYSVTSQPTFTHQQKPASVPSYPTAIGNPSNTPVSSSNKNDEPNFIALHQKNQGSKYNNFGHTQASSAASAAAGANAIVYSGGFGGPPGFLKPYDNGDKSSYINTFGKSGTGHLNSGNPSGNNYNSAPGSASLAGAFAGAGAISGAGTIGSPNGYYGKQPGPRLLTGDGIVRGGCGSGCNSGSNNGYSDGTGFSLGGSLGASKTGLFDGLVAGGLNAAGAATKSIAGAASSAGASSGSFGLSGSFAGSAAIAHASSGATKGGYGRR